LKNEAVAFLRLRREGASNQRNVGFGGARTGQMFAQVVAVGPRTFVREGAILRDKYREISRIKQIKTEKSCELEQAAPKNFPKGRVNSG
jgi:hypothetical protein